MSKRPAFLENSLIVGAHPDDELLWFGAILRDVNRAIIVFEDFWPDPTIGPARAMALANYPRPGLTSFRLAEAATYGCADWSNPNLTSFGIELGKTADLRDAKQKAKRLLGGSTAPLEGIRQCYESNHAELLERLRRELTQDMNVFTHNPWGEYGHEDHIQVFRVLDQLRGEIGFKLWMSNYCTERALPLAMKYFDNADREIVQLPVNKAFAESVAQAYRDSGCWTWAQNWNWFDTECYMEAPTRQVGLKEQGHLFPLNMFNIGAA